MDVCTHQVSSDYVSIYSTKMKNMEFKNGFFNGKLDHRFCHFRVAKEHIV
jgi:hypothetical protein